MGNKEFWRKRIIEVSEKYAKNHKKRMLLTFVAFAVISFFVVFAFMGGINNVIDFLRILFFSLIISVGHFWFNYLMFHDIFSKDLEELQFLEKLKEEYKNAPD